MCNMPRDLSLHYDTHDGRGKSVKTKAAMKKRFARGVVGAYIKTKTKCRAGFGDKRKTGICKAKTGRTGNKLDGTPDMRFKANRGKVMPGKRRLIRNK